MGGCGSKVGDGDDGGGGDGDGDGGAEEFSQAIQLASPTHPGTTYHVRASSHSDLHLKGIRVKGRFLDKF